MGIHAQGNLGSSQAYCTKDSHRHLARILSRRSMSLRISISTLAASLYLGILLMILMATYFFSVRSQHCVTFPKVPSPITLRIL